MGAVSATFVDAVTDLIVDGEVNTDRLTRRAVRGAVAGATAGAVVGYQKTQQEEAQQAALAESQAASPAPGADDTAYQKLEQEIGTENVRGLEALIACQQEEAFRIGLQTEQSSTQEYREAGMVLQALVDRDRGNSAGVTSSLQRFIELNDQLNDLATAERELNELYGMLQDERRVKGRSPVCQ